MKKLYVVCFFILFNSCLSAQPPNWLWAKSAGGSGWESGFSIATTARGDVIVTGIFNSPTINFGSTTLTNSGINHDLFIVKYDSIGNVIWAKSAGGTGNSVLSSVTTDAQGNAYIAGYFDGSYITFGSTTLINAGLSPYADIFIAKYDSSGNVIWATSAGGTDDDLASSVTTDSVGNIYVAGRFDSPSLTFGSITLTNTGLRNIFIAKYDSSGSVLWAKSAGGTGGDLSSKITSNAAGDVFITGYFYSATASFDSIILTNTNATGSYDVFVAKYDSSGHALWAKGAGGFDDDGAYDIATDAAGNVYITGYFFSSSVTFGPTVLLNVNAGFGSDIFVVKYDSIGNELWARSAEGPYSDVAHTVNICPDGSLYVTGTYDLAITIDTLVLTSAGNQDVFIAKYDSNGNVLWAKSAGNVNTDFGPSAVISPEGYLYITGAFYGPSITFGSTVLTNAFALDVYVAKLDTNFFTGIQENFSANEPSIYPNPSHGKFYVLLSPHKPYKLYLYDEMGKEIFSSEVENDKMPVDISTQPKGIYFLTAIDGNKVYSKKIVIQ